MRLLFYTATAVFLIFAGVFAFYALQNGENAGPAKVVLSIDASEKNDARLGTSPNLAGNQTGNEVAPRFSSAEPIAAEASPPALSEEIAPTIEAPPVTEQVAALPNIASGSARGDIERRLAGLGETTGSSDPSPSYEADTESQSQASPVAAADPSQFDLPGESAPQEITQSAPSPAPISRDTLRPDEVEAAIAQSPPAETAPPAQEDTSDAITAAHFINSDTDTPPATAPSDNAGIVASVDTVPAEKNNQTEQQVIALQSATVEDNIQKPVNEPASEPVSPQVSAPASNAFENDPILGPDPDAPSSPPVNIPSATAPPSAPAETETVTAAIEPQPDDSAEAAAKERALRQDFNAFLAEMKKRRQQEENAKISPPPPTPRKRPDNIPAPVRTAAINGWASQQVTTNGIASDGQPRIALLLRGVGRNDNNSEKAITGLPPAVSLAVMPLSVGAQRWASRAREQGHEILVQLPFEPSNYPINNPGPETLLSASSAEENRTRLRSILRRFDGYSGVTNFLGGRFLQSRDALKPVLETLKSKGLIYVGEGNSGHAVLRGVASEIGIRYGNADILIDAHPAPAAIAKALDDLIIIAKKKGSAIGMGYASRNTIEQVEKWAKSANNKGIVLVPVGALARTAGPS